MKKGISLFFAALFLFLLCSCGENRTSASSFGSGMIDGREYVIDYSQNTFTFDGHVCTFALTQGGGGVRLDVTYPDGSTYWWQETASGGHGGWSDGYDENRYVSGDVLRQILEVERLTQQEDSRWQGILSFLLIALGAFYALKPELAWRLAYGWRYQSAEPSHLALGINRVAGILFILFGIVCFFI